MKNKIVFFLIVLTLLTPKNKSAAEEFTEGCTVGCAMENAVPDGRAFCWKNRDMNQNPNQVIYVTGGTYKYIGLGEGMIMEGVNEAGLAVGNSVVYNMDSGSKFDPAQLKEWFDKGYLADYGFVEGKVPEEAKKALNNYYIQDWLLKNCATVDEVRQAIIEDTSDIQNHWVAPGGCFPVIDGLGNASMFEIGDKEYFEYNPTHVNRIAQYSYQICTRANIAHRNTDHTDDIDTGGNRFTESRDNLLNACASGDGVTPLEFINQVCRFGEPGNFIRQNSYENTCNTLLVWGSSASEDNRATTLFASVGQPDYCCFVPVWPAAGNSLSTRLTSTSSTGIAERGWTLFAKDDENDYDQYINSFYSGLETNFAEAASLARQIWEIKGFDVSTADSITDEAAESAWQTMNTMCQGSGRNLNQTPELTEISTTTNGYSVTFSRTANDPDGSIVSTSWDFGDGNSDSGSSVSHTYGSSDIYLACCRIIDNNGSRNSKWIIVNLNFNASYWSTH